MDPRISEMIDRIKARRALTEPTLAQMGTNFALEVSKWAACGFKIVDKEIYDLRIATCMKCEYWDNHSRLGYGKCSAPGCGCGRGKHWLATAKCPLERWGERTPPI